MKVGDLVKLICKDGAIHFELGLFLGKSRSRQVFSSYLMHSFFIEGEIKDRSSLVYFMQVIE